MNTTPKITVGNVRNGLLPDHDLQSKTMSKIKRGTIRSDGMVFRRYHKDSPKGECWGTPEQYAKDLEKHKLLARNLTQEQKTNRAKVAKIWRTKNPDAVKAIELKTTTKRKPAIRKYQAAYKRKQRLDPLKRLKFNARHRIWHVIKAKGWKKPNTTHKLIGCNWEQLKAHLEKQFQEGMTWENYGQWHVDHISPLNLATQPEQLVYLLHYTNLQPLWAKDNLLKSNKK